VGKLGVRRFISRSTGAEQCGNIRAVWGCRRDLRSGLAGGLVCALALALFWSIPSAARCETANDFLANPTTGPTLNELRVHFPEEWAQIRQELSSSDTTNQKWIYLANEVENFIEAHRRDIRAAPDPDIIALLSSRSHLLMVQAVHDPQACATYFTSHPISGNSTDPASWAAWFGFYQRAVIAARTGGEHFTYHRPILSSFYVRLRQALIDRHTPPELVSALIDRRSTDGLSSDAACRASQAFFAALTTLAPLDQASFESSNGP
jgi:hypothetical protein